MIAGDRIVLPAEALAEAKAFVRIEHGGEDGLIEGLLRTSAELCERFTGLVTLARTFDEVLPVKSGWQRLGRSPVRAITGVEGLDEASEAVPLAPEAYQIDIDADGGGWLRVISAGEDDRVRVGYEAGLAAGWADLPEPLRHGIVRLAGHLHAHRTDAAAQPPAAVTALWRPWRRLTIGGGAIR